MRDNLPNMLKAAAKEWREKNKVVSTGETRYDAALEEAADAIEELSRDLDSMNEANIALYGALPKWIPVAEQLSEEYKTVLLLSIGGEVISGYYDSEYKSYCDMSGFRKLCTHWMPLPEPPSEE